jgi:hypothetical protein
MKDQHKMIAGYRDFKQETLDMINVIKGTGNEHIKPLIDRIAKIHQDEVNQIMAETSGPDARTWTAEESHLVKEGSRCRQQAEEHFRLGFMMLIRSVARPTTEY